MGCDALSLEYRVGSTLRCRVDLSKVGIPPVAAWAEHVDTGQREAVAIIDLSDSDFTHLLRAQGAGWTEGDYKLVVCFRGPDPDVPGEEWQTDTVLMQFRVKGKSHA